MISSLINKLQLKKSNKSNKSNKYHRMSITDSLNNENYVQIKNEIDNTDDENNVVYIEENNLTTTSCLIELEQYGEDQLYDHDEHDSEHDDDDVDDDDEEEEEWSKYQSCNNYVVDNDKISKFLSCRQSIIEKDNESTLKKHGYTKIKKISDTVQGII